MGGILGALLISLALVVYYRHRNRQAVPMNATEKRDEIVDHNDEPPGARLNPSNEVLDSGRLRKDTTR